MMGDDEEMESLFEGMILFDPSPPPPAVAVGVGVEDEPPASSITRTSSSAAAAQIEAPQPLDENLFSDLTIVQTTTTPPPQPPLLLASPAPQLSSSSSFNNTNTNTNTNNRKKKKSGGGLRIGYARQFSSSSSPSPAPPPPPPPPPPVVDDDEPPSSSITPPNSNPTTTTTLSTPPIITTHQVSLVRDDDVPFQNTPSSVIVVGPPTHICNGHPLPVDIRQEEEEEDDLIIQDQANNEATTTTPIQLRYDQLKAHISDKLNSSRQTVVSLSALRKHSITRRRKATEDLTVALAKHKEMEKELEEACEAEDFEAADRVSNNLASAEKNNQLLSIALREAEAVCDAIDFKMQEALASQITAEMECAHLLQTFATDAACEADSVLKSAEIMTSKEMDKWFSSTEALEIKKIGLEMESYLVSEVRLELNDSIEHSIKDERGEQEILLKKKEMLKEELEKLLALVKQKEAEIAENDSNIDKVEKKITDAVSGYQKLQSFVNSTFNNLQLGLSQIELESEDFSRRKKEIDGYLSQEEARASKIRELARISADEATMYQEAIDLRKGLVRFISKSQEDKVRLAKTGEKLSLDLQMLKQDISVERASLQDLSSAKSRVQQIIESYKQRLLFIDKRVPELEAEKRVAATARNFKEAGRIATEAKALYVEKEQVQIKMEEAMLELKKAEVDISSVLNRVEELEEDISSKEKELAMTRYERLLLVAAAAMAERSTALELGDVEEAEILLGEAQAADLEAKKLEPVYNLKAEQFEDVSKHLYISMELISSLGRNQLAELAASANVGAL